MADIVMPRLSDTMEEGTILRWLKDDGAEVARGEELVEIETDKATMTYESDQAGVLEILAAVGDSLAVGEVIARVGAADATDGAGSGPARGDAAEDAAGDAARDLEGPAPGGPGGVSARAASASARGSDAPVASPAGASGETGAAQERVKASPLARRIASENGVDLRAVSGSGPGGRIVKADVVGAPAGLAAETPAPAGVGAGSATASATPEGSVPASAATAGDRGAGAPARVSPASFEGVTTAKGNATEVELTRTQQTVARRMAESKATIPDFTLQIEVDMEACVTLRTQLKQLSAPRGGGEEPSDAPDAPDARAHDVPTYNDMVVKAAALALREHPHANGSYRDGRVQVYSRVNVGVAVAAEGALVVPTVFDADEKSLGEIAREARTLAARVRSGEITPPELGGGTFTVSNLGMYGIRSFTAIINPPQAGILSVGALGPRAVVRAGEVVARNTMTLVLACDHRILYGAEAAQFLARIRELLEAPAALTL
jgi:pyruvate dehydrogenase E2 component (dihydrolipoamide acetyltransferase)